MLIKGFVDMDFVNYKKPSLYIACNSCSFKCDRECGKQVCQNGALANSPSIDVPITDLIYKYVHNSLTKAVVFGGLEPFDDINDIIKFIHILREQYSNNDDIVIYTGYTEEEVSRMFYVHYGMLKQYGNVVIKFGRFIPDNDSHYDEVLGVDLNSDNQYAKRI